MTKWIIFLVFTVFLIVSMQTRQLITWPVLMPVFLWLWAWAEELDDCEYASGPAVRVHTVEEKV